MKPATGHLLGLLLATDPRLFSLVVTAVTFAAMDGLRTAVLSSTTGDA